MVTGAASGIGLAYAEAMAEHGAKVTLLDLNAAGLEAAAAALRAKGGEVRTEVVDVTDRAGMYAAFDRSAAALGGIDVVFANAGIDAGPGFLTPEGERNEDGALEVLDERRWDAVIATNLTSVFTTIRAAVRHMKPETSGRIIVTTSVVAIITRRSSARPTCRPRPAPRSLVRQAALELAKYNIQVNAIAPGPFITNIAGGRLRNPRPPEAFGTRVPLNRVATTDEIQPLGAVSRFRRLDIRDRLPIVIDGGQMLGRVD